MDNHLFTIYIYLLMSESRSMKSSQSLILPSINVSVTNLNPLANIPSHVITLLKKNG